MIYDLSSIIVSWNTSRLLHDCLSSIKDNSERIYIETIVVDNGSQDGSPEMVTQKFPECRLIRNEHNLGFATANNIGIRESRGRYVALINSDVIVLQTSFQKLIEFMDRNPRVGMTGPRILNPDGSLQPSARTFPTLRTSFFRALALDRVFSRSSYFSADFMKYWDHKSKRNVDVLNGCFWIVRRKALDEVGLLDEGFYFYSEDVDWCKRFNNHGWEVVFFPDAEAIHVGGASSSMEPLRCFSNMLDAQCRYWQKHHGRVKTALWAMIRLLHYGIRLLGSFITWSLSGFKSEDSSYKVKRSLLVLQWVVQSHLGQTSVAWRQQTND